MHGTGPLDRAREAYARHDWRAACDLFTEAREDAPLQAEDLLAFSDAVWWLGLIGESLAYSEEAYHAFLTEGRASRAAQVAVGMAFNWFLRGGAAIGSGWLNRGRRLLAELAEGPEHSLLIWLEGGQRLASGDLEGALSDAARLRRIGREHADPATTSCGLALESAAAIRAGDAQRAFQLFDEALLPVIAGSVAPELAGNLYCTLMALCHDLADIPRARQWTEATQRWCDGFPSAVMFVGICRVHRAQLLRLAGDWDAAARETEAAARELAELNVEAVAEARYERGEIHRLRGEVAAAEDSYAAADGLGRDPEPGRSLLLLQTGRLEAAHAALAAALAGQTDRLRRARLLAAQVEVACARGDLPGAEAAAEELDGIARTYATVGFRAWAAQARGTVQLCRGAAGEALASLREALTLQRGMHAAHDAATTRGLLARAVRTLGDDAAAVAEEAAARAALADLGAAPALEWLDQCLPGGRALPGGLTPREGEILAAIAEGLTNREVAARLVISEKTVARHLANVFVKLDVGSRTAAAAWAHQHGLARG